MNLRFEYLLDHQISVIKGRSIQLDEDFCLTDLWDLDFMPFEAIESLVVTGHNPLFRSDGCHSDVVLVVIGYLGKGSKYKVLFGWIRHCNIQLREGLESREILIIS